MTHSNPQPLAGSPAGDAGCSDSLSRAFPAQVAQHKTLAGHRCRGSRWALRMVGSLLLAVATLFWAVAPHNCVVYAQPPGVEMPAEAGDATTATPGPSLPDNLDFDIDLGAEEFENFGEEDFQVEEANYFRDTVLPIAIKVALGAVVVLLLAWVAMKLTKPKRKV